MRRLLLICLGLKQINSKHATTKVTVILFILTLTGKSVPLPSSQVPLSNATPLLSQCWGCKLHHGRFFLGPTLPIFTWLSVPLAWDRIPAHQAQVSVKMPWSQPGKQIPLPGANLPADARLCCSSWTQPWVLQLPQQTNCRDHFKKRAKGRGRIPPLCSLQVIQMPSSVKVQLYGYTRPPTRDDKILLVGESSQPYPSMLPSQALS